MQETFDQFKIKIIISVRLWNFEEMNEKKNLHQNFLEMEKVWSNINKTVKATESPFFLWKRKGRKL